MKAEYHLLKARRFEATLKKLDHNEDYETMIENFLLAAAHYINAMLHKHNLVKEDKDIKHNLLYGFLKNINELDQYEKIADLILLLDQLRPSYVYGKGENGNTAKKAEEIFQQIKEFCGEH